MAHVESNAFVAVCIEEVPTLGTARYPSRTSLPSNIRRLNRSIDLIVNCVYQRHHQETAIRDAAVNVTGQEGRERVTASRRSVVNGRSTGMRKIEYMIGVHNELANEQPS
jgi:hypothetical protein